MACSNNIARKNSQARVGLLSGGYPPDFDAIGQYTSRLALALADRGCDVTVFTERQEARGREENDGDSPIHVERFFDPSRPSSIRQLGEACRRAGRPDWLIVQFNPFSFGTRGWCPALPSTLWRLRREQGVRIAVNFHETHVPSWPVNFLAMLAWQYPIFANLAACADRTFVSTNRWKKQVCHWRQQESCHHLPVGSNLPRCALSKIEARAQLGLPQCPIAGIFGNAHPSRLTDWIAFAAARIVDVSKDAALLYVGKDGPEISAACKAPGIPFLDHGMLPDAEAALRIRTMDVLLSPFLDGISTRRSSAIAAMLHDVPVLTTSTRESDDLMLDHPLVHSTPVSAGVGAYGELARTWGSGGLSAGTIPDFAASPFAWNTIASTICGKLGL